MLSPAPEFWERSRANKPGRKTWLTDRRRSDVERLYEWGLKDPEAIAEELDLGVRTVRKYLRELTVDEGVDRNMLAIGWVWSIEDEYGKDSDLATVAHNLNVLRPWGKLTADLPLRVLAEECVLTRRATSDALAELAAKGYVYRKDDRVTILPG